MTLHDRLSLASRIGACAIAGSAAGFLAWAIGAIGIGSLVWAAPLLIVAGLAFGLPSFGILLALALIFARSIRQHTLGWSLALPLAAVAAWHAYDPAGSFPADGMALVALCAIASSGLFLLSNRYLPAPRFGAHA